MARTKEFDPDAVLRRAMDLFRERGCENTSMADLVEHLGIGRASIYATFGGKRDLYLKALARYREITDGAVLESLSRPGPALPAVHALIDGYARESATDGHGCMVVNTAVELAPRDPDAARCVEASWSLLETALTSALTRAQKQGELAAEKDPRALARFLLVLFQGMRVLARTPDPSDRLRDTAAQARALLS
ncbi:TetR family transcriptional regulator [Spirillospora sp. NPDC029432]|uniref:TetR/AcrR family transcriptional regulator n=1 Tax=Spirillospora sp. NPDC029432 TaxID=3154599 RepID=UPI003451AB88